MFPDQSAISTVRLLQLAQARATNGNSPILELFNNDVGAAGNKSYTGYGTNILAKEDPSMWASVTNIFTQQSAAILRGSSSRRGLITNAPKTYVGMGALVLSYNLEQALISGNTATLHGGWGSELGGIDLPTPTSPVFSYSLDLNSTGYTFQPNDTISGLSLDLAPGPLAIAGGGNTGSSLNLSPQQNLQGQQSLGVQGQAGNGIAGLQAGVNNGPMQPADAGSRSLGQTVAEPVNVTSGEYYVDTVDLSLLGPFPLQLRRNYTSLNLQCNEFGYGWKMNFNPYFTVAGSLIYAAELDGTVVAYRYTNSQWKVFAQDNPSLNNNSIYGIGSAANLFNSVITTNSGTNYVIISAPDGSVRTYQVRSFPITSGTSTLNRSMPYLTQWQDNAGNYALFFYGTNSANDDWGQLNRINMANGNTLVLKYDFNGRIVQAIAGDGRFVNYQYDTYGDLVTVTLPDASQNQYQYQHYTFTTNSTTYTDSTHLISQDIKPNGRTVANNYDTLRRVINQASTVGTNLVP